MQLKRIIVLELSYDPQEDGSPSDFRDMSLDDARELATTVHDEFQGGSLYALPTDGEP